MVLKTSKMAINVNNYICNFRREFADNKIWYNGVMQPKNEKAIGFQVHKTMCFT